MNLKKILAWTLGLLTVWVTMIGTASAGYYTTWTGANQVGTVTSANAWDYRTIAGWLLWTDADATADGSLSKVAVEATKSAADTLWTFVEAIIPLIGLVVAAGLIWFIVMAAIRRAKSYMQAKWANSVSPTSK